MNRELELSIIGLFKTAHFLEFDASLLGIVAKENSSEEIEKYRERQLQR